MTKFAMFISENYIKIGIILGVFLGLLINFNYSTIYKDGSKYVWESSIGPVYERAEYGSNGYIGKVILNNEEVYTITLG